MKERKYNRNKKIDARTKNKHHLTPKSRGGKNTQENLLLVDIEKHIYWHKIFKNLTLEEVIELLIRLQRLKKRC